MGKSKAKAVAATKYSLKPKDDAEKVEQIQRILESSSPTNSVWEPTDEEIEILQTHVSDGGTVDDEVKQLESKLNSIYDVIPPVLHHCWSRNFSKKYEDVSAKVQSLYERRYDALQRQHTVSQSLLQLRYPQLHQYAVSEGWHKGIEFESVRSRLSQDITNTTGKNWLQKMHGLLTNTIGRSKAAVDWGSDGDLVTPTPSDSEDGSVVEIDVHRAGKGEVKSDNDETPSDKTVSSGTVAITLGGSEKRSSSSLSSSSTPSPYASAAKRSKNTSSNDNGKMTDADIEAISKELEDVHNSIKGRRDNVNKIFSCMTRSTALLTMECNAFAGHVDTARRSIVDLKNQRAYAEDSRVQYVRTHSRAYRAIYESYLKTRKLLYSIAFWNMNGGFAGKSVEERRTAIKQYYNGTHPFCTSVCGHLQPADPNATIKGSLLLTQEETDECTANLLAELHGPPDPNGVEGVSLLRLPLRVQNQITSDGSWPSDGIGDNNFPSELINVIRQTNAGMDTAYSVPTVLDEHYQFLLDDVTTHDTSDVATPDGATGTKGAGGDEAV